MFAEKLLLGGQHQQVTWACSAWQPGSFLSSIPEAGGGWNGRWLNTQLLCVGWQEGVAPFVSLLDNGEQMLSACR